MKIHSTTQVACGVTPIASSFSRLMALCGVACLAFAGQAMGQTSPVQNGLFTHGDQSYEVVSTAAYKTAADSSSLSLGSSPLGSIQQVGHCSTCGTSSCGGSCGTLPMSTSSCESCGTSCGGGNRMSALSCGADFSNVCAPCQPYRYTMVEALYLSRESEFIGDSGRNIGYAFGDEWGSRITIGSVSDCVNGMEVSFTGPFEWDAVSNFNYTGLNVGGTLFASQGTSRYESEYMSFEANKTINGWEVAKLLIGGRYIMFEEEINSSGTLGAGTFAERYIADNQLLGLQVGLDLLYPVSRIGYSDMRVRLGGYYNSADSFASVNTSGLAPNISQQNSQDDGDLAGVFELGGGVRYQLGDMLAVRAGAELIYLTGVAIAADQVLNAVGRPINTDDAVMITGISVGAELRY